MMTGLPFNAVRAIFLPVIVVNSTSDSGVESQLSLTRENIIMTKSIDADNIKRVDLSHSFSLDKVNCLGIFVIVSLGNIGIIAKLLNCGLLTTNPSVDIVMKRTLFPSKLTRSIMNVSGYLADEF